MKNKVRNNWEPKNNFNFECQREIQGTKEKKI